MSEKLMTKQETAEMKRHGSKREKQAAVSVQIGRITDKLIERSRNVSGSEVSHPSKVTKIYEILQGAGDGHDSVELRRGKVWENAGMLRASEESTGLESTGRTVKPLLRKERVERTVVLKGSGKREYESYGRGVDPVRQVETGTSDLVVDPEGKRKPRIYNNSEYYQNGETNSYPYTQVPKAEEMIQRAAPDLYEIKKAIDSAESKEMKRAA